MSSAAIQVAIFERLSGYPGLTALLVAGGTGVYEYVPQTEASEDDSFFPYVTVGDDDIEGWDTDTDDGIEATLRVHTWSRHKGRLETKQIQEQVYQALHHHGLLVDGVPVVLLHFVDSTAGPDPDGRTYHGVSTFRLLMERRVV